MRGDEFDQWVEKYRPVENPEGDSGFCFDGKYLMFETFRPQLNVVEKAANESPEKVWTIIEGEDGKLYLTNGYHTVNRFGYFITDTGNEGGDVCIAID